MSPQKEKIVTSEPDLPIDRLRLAFRLQERVEEIDQALEIAARPKDVLGFDGAQPATLNEFHQLREAYQARLDQSLASMDPSTREQYEAISTARQTAREEEDSRVQAYLKDHFGVDWVETGRTRFEWKREHPLNVDTELNPGHTWEQYEVTPEVMAEKARLSMELSLVLYVSQLATDPRDRVAFDLSQEASQDLQRISKCLMIQTNRMLTTNGEQRDRIRRFEDVAWNFRRETDGFYRAFEQIAGDSIFEPYKKEEPPTEGTKIEEEPAEVKFYTRECPHCQVQFHSRKAEGKCYNCTLDEITHGNPPEEGDFNSAGIISGTLTDEEWKNLQADLAAVELGR